MKVEVITLGAIAVDKVKKSKAWPTCDICKKVVQSVQTSKDPVLLRIYYTVECHGQTQTIFTERKGDIEIVRAFVNKGTQIKIILNDSSNP